MFKKLKAKIEEGADSGLEKVSFSPRSLPGQAVRTQTQPEVESSPPPMPESGDQDQDEGIAVTDVTQYITKAKPVSLVNLEND